ncbi:class A beta-lactamase-related serine hydrolase [Sporolactobacillus sp. THM7-7]|nr:class A beta-lactamase-related serine hydrolase [Sporolactobacillus sp. THM7-7]
MNRRFSFSTLIILLSGTLFFGGVKVGNALVQHQTTDEEHDKMDKPLNFKSAYPHPWDRPGPSSPVVHMGTARAAGMVERPLDLMDKDIDLAIENRVMPGAVVMVVRRGAIAKWKSYGYAARYTDSNFTEMDHLIKMRTDTIFDLASLSKLFTATAVMQLWDQGAFSLDDPGAKYLPEFSANGKENVTIKQLLTHTSGFRPDPPRHLYEIEGTRENRLNYVLKQPLTEKPGTHDVYSDINYIALGVLVERLTGQREDQYIRDHISEPLNMKDTMYNPPRNLKVRVAATESQPWTGREMIWGEVHDENAWALDGVAGHAGLFSSAHDLAVFGQMMLNHGIYAGKCVLSQKAVQLIKTNWNEAFPGQDHGLGWELSQGWYMDALADLHTIGHTGYTGTSIVVSPNNNTIVILLTNRVHPTRHTPSANEIRRAVARRTADAIPVSMPTKDAAWFSGYGNGLNRTLTAKVDTGHKAHLSYKTWYRTEKGYDLGNLEVSSNGSDWTAIKQYTGSSGDWLNQTIGLPERTEFVRFRYQTDAMVNGRGWYVFDAKLLTDGKAARPEWISDGWVKRGY